MLYLSITYLVLQQLLRVGLLAKRRRANRNRDCGEVAPGQAFEVCFYNVGIFDNSGRCSNKSYSLAAAFVPFGLLLVLAFLGYSC